MDDCLTPEQLEHLARGMAEESDVVMRRHIEECANCQSSFDVCLKNEAALNRLKKLIPAGSMTASSETIPSDAIPGYSIQGELKRGGQGVVYRAVQASTRRDVAIKVMREGPFAGASDKARFDREIEILAQLRHPNIVSIQDSGRASGHFYFVMDLIEGKSLDAWWADIPGEPDDSSPRIRGTLELFATLCDAVNAAHLRGIMHRDLKPSNVLVDDGDHPHVLDFGLARATDGAGQGMTFTGQFVGSLPWASPEQAQGLSGQIDIRTDVYSIGVMLYQVLAGRFPYDVTGGVRDVLDRIVNVDPSRPSGVSRRKIDDELDTIVLKCLSKEPDQRYQSAGEMARDLRRYLSGEPIEAKRHSFGYLLRKQVRRHRVAVSMAAGLALAVTIGFIATLGLWRRSERLRGEVESERTAAVNARNAEAEQREAAQAARDRALAQSDRLRATVDFLDKMLEAVDPIYAMENREITVREVVDVAAKDLEDGALVDQPEVECAIRSTIGTTYQGLGLLDQAEKHLRRALEIQRGLDDGEPRDLVIALNGVATLLEEKGEFTEAEAIYRESLKIALGTFAEVDLDLIKAKNNLAVLLTRTGKLEEAKALLDDIVAHVDQFGMDDAYAGVSVLASAAMVMAKMGDFEGAEPLMQQVVDVRREKLGNTHPKTTQAINNLGFLLLNMDRQSEAERLFREAIELDEKIYGDSHAQLATDLNNLGLVLADFGRIDEAIAVHRRALAIRRESLPKHHPDTILSLLNMAMAIMKDGRFADAEPVLAEVMQAPRKSWPVEPFAAEWIRLYYLGALAGANKTDEARELMKQLAAEFEENPNVPAEIMDQLSDFTRRFEAASPATTQSGE